MMYNRPSFQVPVSNGTSAMCAEKGHSTADSRGNCLCCGQPVIPDDREWPMPAGNAIEYSETRHQLYPVPLMRGAFGVLDRKAQYAELFGGPEDGEIVSIATHGLSADGLEMLVAGHRYRVDDVYKGLVRMSYAGPAAE
jgi:hypothetical protein